MADVTVKYKGSKIAEMSESGTKTLQTSGKYCEGDITVEYVVKETGLENVRRWDVTITNGVPADGSTIVYFVTNDAWLKANRTNPTLTIAIIPKFTIQPDSSASFAMQGIWLQSNMKLIANSDGTEFNSLSAYIKTNGSVTPQVRSYPLTTSNNIGDICVTSSGGLYALATSGYPVAVGEYTVIAFIA